MELFMRIMFAVMKNYVCVDMIFILPTFFVVVILLMRSTLMYVAMRNWCCRIATPVVVIPPFITPILTSVAMES